ncbi:MAG: hypothetical protein RLZZ90_287, partial [Actinomycetota bacterium]
MKRSSKTLASLGALAVLALSVAGCAPAAEETAAPEEEITIAFVMGAESDPFFQAMKLGAEE